MKKLLLLVMALVLSSAHAQQTLPAEPVKPAASVAVALVAASIILPAAIITGKRAELCAAMGGTYFPNSDGLDQCPGGAWSALIGIKEKQNGGT